MSNHLRHCPNHRKPLPCPDCAWIQKSAQAAIAVIEPPAAEPEIPAVNREIPAINPIVPPTHPEIPDTNPVTVSVTVEELPPPPKKRGRPRKLGKIYSTEAERKRAERATKKREKLLNETIAEQEVDDRTGGKDGPGKFMTDAPRGKGTLASGSGGKKPQSFEQMAGYSENTGLMGPKKTETDPFEMSLPRSFYTINEETDAHQNWDVLQKQVDIILANPNLPLNIRALLENASIDEIDQILSNTTYQGNTGGSTGRRVDTNSAAIDDVEATRQQFRKNEPIYEGTSGPPPIIRTDEQARIDNCLGQLRTDDRFCRWEKNEKDDGFVCQLCDERLTAVSASGVGDHFLARHVKQTRRFFREHGVRFNKAYLGITDNQNRSKKN